MARGTPLFVGGTRSQWKRSAPIRLPFRHFTYITPMCWLLAAGDVRTIRARAACDVRPCDFDDWALPCVPFFCPATPIGLVDSQPHRASRPTFTFG
ncbi:uncharacterized protein SCHCODRAFT_02610874 [Schizophyllum commune H4-8]|uniref:uncharacterized protein n=1 Tax=Schizophyllum commune (strain H4-8 / FGSC 9210) TaxID=578458 RepID=UPI00215ECCF4|nr:uncharacterized protein SCHCODRAFT_02610874 [Schizophyllum commune H4-8]KAI5898009.1 hypothetical protein SCHCODRAFT_02610874 [Schizophyllum commune H4-8]